MNDIRNYGDKELSLLVFNDEYFYTERKDTDFLQALINEEFLYTEKQMSVLANDLVEDDIEMARFEDSEVARHEKMAGA
jgi:hypothetical protein